MTSTLTGRTRCRLGLFGKLVLQVEYATREPHPGTEGRGTDWLWTGRQWRDARVEDLQGFDLDKVIAAADSGTVSFPPGVIRQERREAVARELDRRAQP